MVDIITEIIIKQPKNVVWKYAADPENAPHWYVNIKAVEWKTPKNLSVGSRIAFKAQFLGRKLAYVYEIAELIPGEKLVMRTVGGPFPMQTTYVWDAVDGQTTRMTLHNEGNPFGFSKLMASFVSFAIRRANKKDLARLKQCLEAGKT